MLLYSLLRAVIQLLSELTATEKHNSAIPGNLTVSHLFHFVLWRAVVTHSVSKLSYRYWQYFRACLFNRLTYFFTLLSCAHLSDKTAELQDILCGRFLYPTTLIYLWLTAVFELSWTLLWHLKGNSMGDNGKMWR